MYHKENPAINSYFIIVSIHCRGNVFTKLLPSNISGVAHREQGDLIYLICSK